MSDSKFKNFLFAARQKLKTWAVERTALLRSKTTETDLNYINENLTKYN